MVLAMAARVGRDEVKDFSAAKSAQFHYLRFSESWMSFESQASHSNSNGGAVGKT
jgi:hypothetical protein